MHSSPEREKTYQLKQILSSLRSPSRSIKTALHRPQRVTSAVSRSSVSGPSRVPPTDVNRLCRYPYIHQFRFQIIVEVRRRLIDACCRITRVELFTMRSAARRDQIAQSQQPLESSVHRLIRPSVHPCVHRTIGARLGGHFTRCPMRRCGLPLGRRCVVPRSTPRDAAARSRLTDGKTSGLSRHGVVSAQSGPRRRKLMSERDVI